MRRTVAVLVAVAALTVPGPVGAGPYGTADTFPPSAPSDAVVTLAGLTPAPTSLSFSPSGDVLYVAGAAGTVSAHPVVGGVAIGAPTTFLDRLGSTTGVLATGDGVFVSVLSDGAGAVLRATDSDGDGVANAVDIVISGIPNGRHNTNGLAIGPHDGLLYIANGNSTDSGFGAEGGNPEVQPYSGSVLRVDPAATGLQPDPSMVVATGWRNIYDLAFVPPGHPASGGIASVLAVPENGPDGQTYNGVTRPNGEDTLAMFDTADGVVEHYGFPWCLYHRVRGGLDGFTQDPSEGSCDPLTSDAFNGLVSPAARAKPVALFGAHVSADGLAFNPGTSLPDAYDGDLFVALFGNFFGDTVAGHKVVRVRFDDSGAVASVDDFLTNVLPLDLTFAPDGALWVADVAGPVYRVAGVG